MVTISHFARVVTVVRQFLACAANQRIIYSQIKVGEKSYGCLKGWPFHEGHSFFNVSFTVHVSANYIIDCSPLPWNVENLRFASFYETRAPPVSFHLLESRPMSNEREGEEKGEMKDTHNVYPPTIPSRIGHETKFWDWNLLPRIRYLSATRASVSWIPPCPITRLHKNAYVELCFLRLRV